MLSTITAAETQFRHEAESRRERRAARLDPERRAPAHTLTASRDRVERPAHARATWPRPIGVAHASPRPASPSSRVAELDAASA